MKLRLKKAFNISQSQSSNIIDKLNANIKVSTVLFSYAKDDLAKSIKDRDKFLGDFLYDNYSYIVKSTDRITYNEQLKELLIYDDPHTPTDSDGTYKENY